MSSFRDDPSVKVFLISLKAGGLGLNLTAANKVVLIDPWWNPAQEDQAVDRIHRLGQTRPVEIVRFIARGSLEERILDLQVGRPSFSPASCVSRRMVWLVSHQIHACS